MKKHFFLLGLLLWAGLAVQAQDDGPSVFQFSGLLIDGSHPDSAKAIPYAQIRVNHTRQGALTNEDGFYSIPVGYYDTLYFSHVGYYPDRLIVANYLQNYQGNTQYIYAINYLIENPAAIDTVYIFPYNTPEELRSYVLNMDGDPNSPQAIAARNLDPRVIDAMINTLPVDASERIMVGRQMYYSYYENRNLMPTALQFNPVAAAALLQYILQKTEKRKNKDLNYWE